MATAGLGIAPYALFADVPASRNDDTRPKLAVCLSIGGLHGYAHIGAVRAFDRIGLQPDIVCGTSVGAIVGLLDAAYQTFHIMVNRLIDEQIARADFAIRLDVHQFMRGEGGLQNLMQQAEQSVYRHRVDLLAALSQAGIPQSAERDSEQSAM